MAQTYTLDDYTNSIVVGRKTYPTKINGKTVNASKGLNVGSFINRSERARKLVAEIEVERQQCRMIKEIIEEKSKVELVAGDIINITNGVRKFNIKWGLLIGDFMFLRGADLVICTEVAQYATLDEWARFIGSLLKPIAIRLG